MIKRAGLVIAVFIIAASAAICAGGQKSQVDPSKNEYVSNVVLDGKNLGLQEDALGDIFSDAIRSALNVDIAFVAASEIRLPEEAIPAGKVNVDTVAALVTYPEETMAVVRLTGNQITKALEYALSSYPKPTYRFLQVSGLVVTFDPSKPQGSRIVSVLVGKETLKPSNVYDVAMTRALARGAMAYWRVWSRSDIKSDDNPQLVSDAVKNYLGKSPTTDYSKLDRIVTLKPSVKGQIK